METNDSADLQSKLMKVYGELKNGQSEGALDRLTKIQSDWPKDSNVEHLLALTQKSLGDLAKSESHFYQSLRLEQKQPEVHNNLANLLKSQGQYSGAQKHYQQALTLQPKYLEAQRNLAICYQSQQDYPSAIVAYQNALALRANDVSAINGMADCLRLTGESHLAHEAYQQALELDPKNFKSWHNLGLNYHLQGALSEAIKCYQRAYDIAPEKPSVIQSLALSLYERGDVASAIELFSTALNADPGNVQLHEHLNNMLWETKYADQFGDSYVSAIRQLPDSREISLSYVTLLYNAGRVQQAKKVLDTLGLNISASHEVLSLKGQIDAELGDYDLAYDSLALSLHQQYSKDVARQMTKIDIILERYGQAQDMLAIMFENAPDCQLTWALQGLVWRLSGDSRYQWLCDYKQFVKTYQLEVPPGYASLDDFLSALRDVLNPMHRNEREPLQQTLRNGTQTAARLLHSPSRVLQELKGCLSNIVKNYIESFPDDNSHPLLGRKKLKFEFSGSWSVKLRANGFHVNHVHPDGWISSSCYITIPSCISQNEEVGTSHQGHIKFGESPLQLGDREIIELSLEPKPGMVVLFPSYFWHGTHPFSGGPSDYRMTAPFDIVPQ